MLVGGCGGEKTFLLHGGCFKYLMSVAKRREVVASYQPGPSSYLDATQVPSKTRLPKSLRTRSGRVDHCAAARRMCKALLATGLGSRRLSVGSMALLPRIVNSPS